VGKELGPIAKPDDIRFADNLPKTRSGKIMRRLLKAIARGEEITQDVSTLENPAILDQLRGVDSKSRRTVTAKPKRAKSRSPASRGAKRKSSAAGRKGRAKATRRTAAAARRTARRVVKKAVTVRAVAKRARTRSAGRRRR